MEVAVAPLAGESVGGENLHDVPAGSPEHESVIAELNPFMPAVVTVNEAEWPAEIVKAAGVAEMVKSAVGVFAVFAVNAANNPCCSLARPAVMYKVLGSAVWPELSKSSSQTDGLTITAPLESFIWLTNVPVAKLKALIVPSPKFPISKSPPRDPN